ncbi:unnamed protein product [Bursaphelenchus okinawaensis]|uniref:Uncharacterized protein n=1 Tax=Bursaphelenchus okinawaensis TaxID=465554 RepID=A0A811LD97_9BILA|nr:unnamed protein product [Bursaphelenchus okinawaensis]CAG9121168.1 unnamed protein product [Bursaphelenchus okinawaensis]
MYKRLHFVLLCIFLLFTANSAENPAKSKKTEDETTLLEEETIIILTEELEPKKDEERISGDFLTDEDIDLMEHTGSSPALITQEVEEKDALSDIFVEFMPEKKPPGEINSQAKQLYEDALQVLGRKRWAQVDVADLKNAYKEMEKAADMGHPDAQKILGFSYLFGNHRWSIDEARNIFEKLAKNGSPDAHLGLGFIYSTGLGMDEPDPAKGLLHYTISALGGNPLAQMAVGYRYHAGVNVKADCDVALNWYKRVAQKVADKVKLTGSPSIQRIRIPDEVESTANSGSMVDNNLFLYYTYLAETGDVPATIALATLYLTGGKGVPMDLEEAARHFKVAAQAGNTQAYAYLGRMYLEGTPSTPQSNSTAFDYFKKASDKGNAIAQSGLGLMFLVGYGVDQDSNLAFKLFKMAADQGSSDGQLHLGQMFFYGIGVEKNYKQAIQYFQLAAQSGHILALYNLANIHATGTGVQRSCNLATELMKNVAERGRWAERFVDAFSKFMLGHNEESAIRYLFLAELGYEVAQTNFAFLMDKSEGRQQLFKPDQTYKRAYQYWLRSANQEYAYARVKLGDYLFYGLGTQIDLAAAANQYKAAATSHQNAQALFNLAYMHENGLGVSRDLHLAKRFYDLAAETSTDAIVPVTLALIKLRFMFIADFFTAGFLFDSNGDSVFEKFLGPQWDLYLMTLFFGLAIWLLIVYWHYRRQLDNQSPSDPTPSQQNLRPNNGQGGPNHGQGGLNQGQTGSQNLSTYQAGPSSQSTLSTQKTTTSTSPGPAATSSTAPLNPGATSLDSGASASVNLDQSSNDPNRIQDQPLD